MPCYVRLSSILSCDESQRGILWLDFLPCACLDFDLDELV